jgi:Mg2+ and Co2+ transporter CorA
MTKRPDTNTNWGRWYAVVLGVLVVQIILYYLFTIYWS